MATAGVTPWPRVLPLKCPYCAVTTLGDVPVKTFPYTLDQGYAYSGVALRPGNQIFVTWRIIFVGSSVWNLVCVTRLVLRILTL